MRDKIRDMSNTFLKCKSSAWSGLVMINDITKFPMTLTFVTHQVNSTSKNKQIVWYNMQECADAYDEAEKLDVNLDQLTFDDDGKFCFTNRSLALIVQSKAAIDYGS